MPLILAPDCALPPLGREPAMQGPDELELELELELECEVDDEVELVLADIEVAVPLEEAE